MSKAARALRLALNNGSKEEATTAFRQAFSHAEREGVRLCDLHEISVEPGMSRLREQELVDKYNGMLAQAKRLIEERDKALNELETYKQMYQYAAEARSANDEASEKLRKLKAYINRL